MNIRDSARVNILSLYAWPAGTKNGTNGNGAKKSSAQCFKMRATKL